MKSTKKIFACIMCAFIVLGITSCDKDDNDNNNVNVPADIQKSLPGTYADKMLINNVKADSMHVNIASGKITFNLPLDTLVKLSKDLRTSLSRPNKSKSLALSIPSLINSRIEDFPLPRPPMIEFNQGLNSTFKGAGRPAYLAFSTVTERNSVLEELLGSVVSLSERIIEDEPSTKASLSPSIEGVDIFTQV